MKLFSVLRAAAAALLLTTAFAGCADEGPDADTQDATAATARFETFKGDDGQHYFQLIAANGERVLRSEGYKSLASAKGGITSVQKNAATASRFKLQSTDSGEFYFTLTASNGQVIGLSETYASKANAQRGIDAVTLAAKSAPGVAATNGGPVFETFKGQDSKYYFHLKAGNGQIVLSSEGYASKSSATSGIATVKKNAVDASHFTIAEGANGQHYFRLASANHKIIGRSEMYASKSGALHGAATVVDIVRELTNAGTVADATIETQIEAAAVDLLFTSESDFPYTFVRAELDGTPEINEALVRAKFAEEVDGDEAADKPMSSLFAMSDTWEEWKAKEIGCSDPEDPVALEQCNRTRALEAVLESNLTDIHVYYFGGHGKAGQVDGIGVSIFIVGRSPEGNLVGIRTIAIWT